MSPESRTKRLFLLRGLGDKCGGKPVDKGDWWRKRWEQSSRPVEIIGRLLG